MDFVEARQRAKMTRKESAKYFKLSLSTISRYEKTGKAPTAIIECLRMIAGDMPCFSNTNDFTGWTFSGGFLWSPANDCFTSGDILAIIYDKQIIKELDHLLKEEKKRVLHDMKSNIIQFPDRLKKQNLKA